jgi:hypothetical protein
MSQPSKIIASENCHWYSREGVACYEVPCTTKTGMRPTTIKDAKKLDLVPSFTLIKDQISKPGLETWKLNQLLAAALTLPRLEKEPLDDFARRVIHDYQEQGRKARERGKELHDAIESFVQGRLDSRGWYYKHIEKTYKLLLQAGINIQKGAAEHSFASPLGYGGKIDWHDSGALIDFKTKDRIDDKKQLVWDEHPMQCAAYGYGVFNVVPPEGVARFRGLNVFVGVDDREVRVLEHSWEDLERGWEMFHALLRYWQIKNKFEVYI